MAIDAIGGATSSSSEVPSAASLSQEDFMRILLAQLQFQDPLKPMDNQEFVAQLAQFSGLEINRQQSEKIDQLLAIQSADQSVAMIGKKVDVQTANGSSTSGTVTAVSFRSGEPRLTLDLSGTTLTDVRLSDVITVLR
jgi:flagellar basal-body rod modification protein FlgD